MSGKDNGGVPKEPEALRLENLLRISPVSPSTEISVMDRVNWILNIGTGPRSFMRLVSLLKSYMTENEFLRKEVDSLREELDRKHR